MLTGKTPVGRLPQPDLLACCTNICQTVLYWYKALAEHFERAARPRRHPVRLRRGEAAPRPVRPRAARGARRRRRDGQRQTRRPRRARRGDAPARRRASRLWGECLATARSRPAPWTGFDGFFHIAPIVALRGSEECNAYYRLLLDELNDRVRQRDRRDQRREAPAALGQPADLVRRAGAVARSWPSAGFNFACTSYTNAWAEAGVQVEASDPYGSMAHAYTHIILNQDLTNRLGILRRLAARLLLRRRDPSQRPLLQAVLDRPGRPEGAARHGARNPRPPPRGRSQRPARLVGSAGREPADRVHGELRVTAARSASTSAARRARPSRSTATGAILARRVEPAHPRIDIQAARLLDDAALRGSERSCPSARPATAASASGPPAPSPRSPATPAAPSLSSAAPGSSSTWAGRTRKVIRLGAGGEVLDFAMNDKCAAGTGRFLEVILGRLHVPFAEVADHGCRARRGRSPSPAPARSSPRAR